jgi:hypothetical protein
VRECNKDPSDMPGSLFCNRACSGYIWRLVHVGFQTCPLGKFIGIFEVVDIPDLCDKCWRTNKSDTGNQCEDLEFPGLTCQRFPDPSFK